MFRIIIKLGTFLFGMLLGMLFTALLFAATPVTFGLAILYQFLVIVAVGIIVGILAVLLSRPFIIIGTAFNGSYLVGNVIDSEWVHSGIAELLFNIFDKFQSSIAFDSANWKAYLILGGVVILAIVGVVVQWRYTAGAPEKAKDKQEEGYPLLTGDV